MNDNDQSSATHIQSVAIAGFWRRLLAFIIDSLVLGTVGFVLGLAFFDYFVELGEWGRIVGFFIALFYFGIMNSGISKGQTIGKRLTKIKVVSATGELLPLSKSVVRFVVFSVAFLLNGAPLPQDILFSWVGSVIVSLAVFGLLASIIYLFIFNRKTRQSIHDLVVGSYVVKADSAPDPIRTSAWKGHYAVVSLLLVAAGLAPIVIGYLAPKEPFNYLSSIQGALQTQPEVKYANVSTGTNFVKFRNQDTKFSTYLSSRIVLVKKIDDYDGLANKLARIMLETYPQAGEKDVIAVTISYGYDIGISSSWQNQNFSFPPNQWRERFKSQLKNTV
jgi:uncharacterized RDD family membrane protein YckC